MVKPLVLLSMFLLYSGILHAQEVSGPIIPPEFPQRVKILYDLEFEEDFFITHKASRWIWDDFSGPFPDQQEAWYQSLETALGNSEKVAQVVRSPKGTDLFTQALSRGIPAFIHIQVSGAIDTAQVRYTFRGVFSDRYVFENSFEEEGVPREDDLLSYFWLPLRSDLEAFLEQVLIRPPLLIRGPAGTLVYGFSQEPLCIPEEEYVFVDVPIPGTYKWKTVHKRYMNREGLFMADRDHLVLTLPRNRYSFLNFLRFFNKKHNTLK